MNKTLKYILSIVMFIFFGCSIDNDSNNGKNEENGSITENKTQEQILAEYFSGIWILPSESSFGYDFMDLTLSHGSNDKLDLRIYDKEENGFSIERFSYKNLTVTYIYRDYWTSLGRWEIRDFYLFTNGTDRIAVGYVFEGWNREPKTLFFSDYFGSNALSNISLAYIRK